VVTRLYLPSSGTAPISPAFDASWEATGAPTRLPLSTGKDEHSAVLSVAVAAILNVPAGAVDIAIAQFISAPLSGNQTISGAIKGQIRALESSGTGDLDPQCVIRVLSNDGTTVRGTLIASDTSGLGHEFNTALRNVKYPKGGSTTPTSVNALDGDRLCIEVGYRKHESATTSRTGTLSFGDNAGTDLAEDETTTTANDPWFEFADTLTFQAVGIRVSQTPLLVATKPVPDTRVSQTVLLIAAGALVPARVSQTVLLVAAGAPRVTSVSQTVLLVAVENNPSAHPFAWATIIG